MSCDQNDLWEKYKLSVKKIVVCDKLPVSRLPSESGFSSVKVGNDIDRTKHSQCKYVETFQIVKNKNYHIATPSRRELRSVVANMTLDLHSCTLDIVHETLLRFCIKCVSQNEKIALIITGKGSGVIRSATEEWIRDNPSIIMKYSRIYDSSCGYGSFYIWVRRNGIMLYN